MASSRRIYRHVVLSAILVVLSGCDSWQEPARPSYPQLSLLLSNASFLLPDTISNSWAFQVVFFSGMPYSPVNPDRINDDTYRAMARAVYRVGDSAGAYAYVAVNGTELSFQPLWPWNYLYDWSTSGGLQVGSAIVWSIQPTMNSPVYHDTITAPQAFGRLALSGDSVFYREQSNVITWQNVEPGTEIGIELSWMHNSDSSAGGKSAFLGVVEDNGSFTLTPQHLQEAEVPAHATHLAVTLYRVRWKNDLVYENNRKAATIVCVDKQIGAPLR